MTPEQAETPFAIIDRAVYDDQYSTNKPKYDRFISELQAEFKLILKEAEISFLDVQGRVKDRDSAYDKIGRKKIDDPFYNIEDWCGLRIICYYEDDIANISRLLTRGYEIVKRYDVQNRLGINQFGYRSTHFILHSKWAEDPGKFEGLNGLVAEVQVRTMLMHAWAEVEHKLQYKSKSAVPKQFRRHLSALSAQFEAADIQILVIKDGIANYRNALRDFTTVDEFKKLELNIDSLTALMKIAYPEDAPFVDNAARNIFPLFEEAELTMEELIEGYQAGKDFVELAGEQAALRIGIVTYPNDRHKPLFASGPFELLQAAVALGSEQYFEYLMRLKHDPERTSNPWYWYHGINRARGRAIDLRRQRS